METWGDTYTSLQAGLLQLDQARVWEDLDSEYFDDDYYEDDCS